MSQHGPEMKARFRKYMLRVLLVLVLGPVTGMALVAVAARVLPTLMGPLGIATGLGTFIGAFLVHRATVRCPACNVWVLPVGMNGVVPSQCPGCKVDLR